MSFQNTQVNEQIECIKRDQELASGAFTYPVCICVCVFSRVHFVIEKVLILNLTHCIWWKIANSLQWIFVCISNEIGVRVCAYTNVHMEHHRCALRNVHRASNFLSDLISLVLLLLFNGLMF